MARGRHRATPARTSRLVVGLVVLTIAGPAGLTLVGPTVAAALTTEQGAFATSPVAVAPSAPDAQADSSSASAEPAGGPAAATPERPRQVRLPSGTSVPIRPVSTTADGTLAVPRDIRVAGWWRGGSRLGDPFGSTLLAAHVDSDSQGLGPYAELLTARAGQTIVLTSANLQQRFSVTSLRLLPQGTLSSHDEIYAADGPRRVTLVTCAGPYVPSRGGYQQLAVVTATAVDEPIRRSA